VTLACNLQVGYRLTICALVILICTQTPFSQNGTGRATLPSIRDAEESSRFIVAFELTEENEFNFIWPFESMRPSSYETVAMVVETMPRVRTKNSGDRAELLIASRDLKFNGSRLKPTRIANGRAYFLVKLDQGRLKLSLTIPSGTSLDSQHNEARIKLYQLSTDPHQLEIKDRRRYQW
jgi:hypothetical protein